MLLGALAGLVKAFNLVNEATGGYAGAILVTSGLVIGLVTALGVLSGFFTASLIPAFFAGTSALNVFNLSMGTAAASTALLVGSLLLLGAVIAALVINFAGFRDRVTASFVAVEVAGRSLWEGFKNAGKASVNSVTGLFADGINFIIEKINAAIEEYNKIREKINKDPIEPLDAVDRKSVV